MFTANDGSTLTSNGAGKAPRIVCKFLRDTLMIQTTLQIPNHICILKISLSHTWVVWMLDTCTAATSVNVAAE